MFWIILIIIGAIFSIHGYIKVSNFNKTRDYSVSVKKPVFATICTCTSVISILVFISQGIMGITDYPYLVSKLAEAETLQARVKDIKNANYKYENNNALVAGSIENWKQSTNLSDYVTQLAKTEAKYNSYLKKCIAYKDTFILYFISTGWAISDKVYDLKYIED